LQHALLLDWLSLVQNKAPACFVGFFVIVGGLFLRRPGEGLPTLTLLLIMFFMIEGIIFLP
jgi:hypothetical protein